VDQSECFQALNGGSDTSKRPALWRQLDATEQFVAYLEGTTGRDYSELFQALNEVGGDRTEHRTAVEFVDYVAGTTGISRSELFQALNEVGVRSIKGATLAEIGVSKDQSSRYRHRGTARGDPPRVSVFGFENHRHHRRR
jgi:hypothetical protein